MTPRPWREVIIPHADVLKGTFQQSEFAADISAVVSGAAPDVYKLAGPFFARTFVTAGMGQLLEQVARRLAGKGGEPVIQLQTSFGGGKTHTLLAVYHLATREGPIADLPGVSEVIERAGLTDVPRATVAVIDGTKNGPGQPWKRGRTVMNTLWGDLAHQLGGADGFAKVKGADATGTSPGKEVLRELLAAAAPCVVLLDELVVYLRQFEAGKDYSGGSYDSNLSFVQALTEAAKLVPTAVVLASLTDSKFASTGERGSRAIVALEDIFGRVQALWRPVSTEEGFEIVRRRLFEPVSDPAARDACCRAFAELYRAEGSKLPAETQDARYAERLVQAYPIHPELFDRLYEDWTHLEGFQRTRGVLKLMAKVVHRLWDGANKDPMILPGDLPLADRDARQELTYLLPNGWETVVEGDIDGPRSETAELEKREPRFGQIAAARRVARTLFMGTAPASAALQPGTRGLDRGRVLLGCLQPGQSAGVYADALGRLADRLHYLNLSGDKSQDATRYWFDTKANLRREMEDRKRRLGDKPEVRAKVEAVIKQEFAGSRLFDGLHVFTPHADVPDDSALRLVVLPPDTGFDREVPRHAEAAVRDYLQNHGNQPRHRANRLLFLVGDHAVLPRLMESARTALAWKSIVDDADNGQLEILPAQRRSADTEAKSANLAVPRTARECFRWLLCPVQDVPTAQRPGVEEHAVATSGGSAAAEVDRVCKDNELIIEEWAPTHLRAQLQSLYWRADRPAERAAAFWEDTLRYPYLPRLRDRNVLARVVRTGSAGRDFFGTAYGQVGDKFEGFDFGSGEARFDDALLLIEPVAAKAYAIREKSLVVVTPPEVDKLPDAGTDARPDDTPGGVTPPQGRERLKPLHHYQGTVGIPITTAKLALMRLADELVAVLARDPDAKVTVTLEMKAEFLGGVSDATRRAVTENGKTLNVEQNWE